MGMMSTGKLLEFKSTLAAKSKNGNAKLFSAICTALLQNAEINGYQSFAILDLALVPSLQFSEDMSGFGFTRKQAGGNSKFDTWKPWIPFPSMQCNNT